MAAAAIMNVYNFCVSIVAFICGCINRNNVSPAYDAPSRDTSIVNVRLCKVCRHQGLAEVGSMEDWHKYYTTTWYRRHRHRSSLQEIITNERPSTLNTIRETKRWWLSRHHHISRKVICLYDETGKPLYRKRVGVSIGFDASRGIEERGWVGDSRRRRGPPVARHICTIEKNTQHMIWLRFNGFRLRDDDDGEDRWDRRWEGREVMIDLSSLCHRFSGKSHGLR
jgi:hypothetical protein